MYKSYGECLILKFKENVFYNPKPQMICYRK